MLKKIVIILCLVIPTVFLTNLLLQNKDHIGTKKEVVEYTYGIDGLECASCLGRVKSSLAELPLDVVSLDFESKEIVLKYDDYKVTLEAINQALSSEKIKLTNLPKDSLRVIDYKIKYN